MFSLYRWCFEWICPQRKIKKKKGIRNNGNTCYLNSVLQILASTPEFSNCLPNLNCDLSRTLLSIIRMVNRELDANLKREINYLLRLLSQTHSSFSLGIQNDSKELFAIIIEKCAENNETLDKLFFIKVNKIFECDNRHKEEKEEIYSFLVVPDYFDQDINGYIQHSEEIVHFKGINKIFCSSCQDLIDSKVKTDYHLPPILVLYFSGENPKRRNIMEYDEFKGKRYNLYGLICFDSFYHHYIAFTLDDGVWREYNDKFVSDKMPNFNYAYMAFYRAS